MNCSRRRFLATAGSIGAGLLGASPSMAANAPSSRVAIGRCRDYDATVTPTLSTMFDQLGGLSKLVSGKTVAIKVNLTGGPYLRLGYEPAERSHYTHPAVIGSTIHLLDRAGARRIRVLEGCFSSDAPLEEFMYETGWDPARLVSAGKKVEFENTNWLDRSSSYARFTVPGKGHVYPGFDLVSAYRDCDVFVSIAKMKEHLTAGITLTMKNCFGITPITIYGDGAGADEPSVRPRGGRGMFHSGYRSPSKSAPQEVEGVGKDQYTRVPGIVADIVASRPIHLGIIDGIATMTAGEGPWAANSLVVTPGLLVAGLNPVCTDAVGAALMGFDPMAKRGKPPFERCASTLELAEAHGVGTRDLSKIEIVGAPLKGSVYSFRAHPEGRTRARAGFPAGIFG